MDQVREDWPDWIAQLCERIAANNWEGAANMLGCCLDVFNYRDRCERRRMFTLPCVMANTKTLWPLLLPEITREHRARVKQQMRRFGWDI